LASIREFSNDYLPPAWASRPKAREHRVGSNTYYDVLQVTEKATPTQIKSAYRMLAKRYHPDTNHSPGAEESFRRVHQAYQVLSDPAKRLQYDLLFAHIRIITARRSARSTQAEPHATQPSPPPHRARSSVHDWVHSYRAYCALLIFLVVLAWGFTNLRSQKPQKQARIAPLQAQIEVRNSRQRAPISGKQFEQSGTAEQRPTINEMFDQAAEYCGEKFELIRANLTMPKTDGIALLERIKGSADVPVMAFNAVRNSLYDSRLEPSASGQVKNAHRNDPMNLESLLATQSDPLRPAMQELEHSYVVTLKILNDALSF
jgi:DnaJ-domain-containing protein 1/CheY-like chemotaxis protein